jgi:hypothetical protein
MVMGSPRSENASEKDSTNSCVWDSPSIKHQAEGKGGRTFTGSGAGLAQSVPARCRGLGCTVAACGTGALKGPDDKTSSGGGEGGKRGRRY